MGRDALGELSRMIEASGTRPTIPPHRLRNENRSTLVERFQLHIDVTEGDKGLYADVEATAPRLSRKIKRLLAEHEVLAEMLTDLRAAIASAKTKPAEVATVRTVATRMLTQLSKHRQRGSDLVWEAYAFDVGGEN